MSPSRSNQINFRMQGNFVIDEEDMDMSEGEGNDENENGKGFQEEKEDGIQGTCDDDVERAQMKDHCHGPTEACFPGHENDQKDKIIDVKTQKESHGLREDIRAETNDLVFEKGECYNLNTVGMQTFAEATGAESHPQSGSIWKQNVSNRTSSSCKHFKAVNNVTHSLNPEGCGRKIQREESVDNTRLTTMELKKEGMPNPDAKQGMKQDKDDTTNVQCAKNIGNMGQLTSKKLDAGNSEYNTEEKRDGSSPKPIGVRPEKQGFSSKIESKDFEGKNEDLNIRNVTDELDDIHNNPYNQPFESNSVCRKQGHLDKHCYQEQPTADVAKVHIAIKPQIQKEKNRGYDNEHGKPRMMDSRQARNVMGNKKDDKKQGAIDMVVPANSGASNSNKSNKLEKTRRSKDFEIEQSNETKSFAVSKSLEVCSHESQPMSLQDPMLCVTYGKKGLLELLQADENATETALAGKISEDGLELTGMIQAIELDAKEMKMEIKNILLNATIEKLISAMYLAEAEVAFSRFQGTSE